MQLWKKLNDPNAPHIDVHPNKKTIDFGKSLVAVWTDEFDCGRETEYWYCIKDDVLDIFSIKAKRRYEINKGIKNFNVSVIKPSNHADEMYRVYVESLKGYKGNRTPISFEKYREGINGWDKSECCVFAAYDNEKNAMCGYSDVWLRRPYLPISSLKTIPEFERGGVNFALVYAICTYFEDEISKGAYLCDGVRNSLHQTHFQDFLIKYFGFRRAYCNLHIAYRWYLKPVVLIAFPFRQKFKNKIPQLYSLLKMEAWSRGIKEE